MNPTLHAGDGLYSFYINLATGNLEIREYDPVNGQLLGSHVFVDTGGMASPFGFAWHEDRFVTLIQNAAGRRGLVEIHPSTGVGALVGWSNGQLFYPLPESNPQTGELLYLNLETFNTFRLYRVDASTGVETPGPYLHGATTALNSFCIDTAGTGYGTNDLNLFRLEPATGLTTALGAIVGASPSLGFLELACSSTGDIVGMSVEGAPYTTSGLYRIDVQSLTATPLVLMPGSPGHSLPALGVAFVRDRAGTTYCQAKTNSLSCTPSIVAHGFPSVTGEDGYQIACNNVRSQTTGVLLYGVGGPASIPFQGGLLCIGGATRRTPAVNSQGTPPGSPSCAGVWSVDFNAHLWRLNPQSVPPGTTIHAQWYGRDPGLPAPDSTSLSDGLRFTLLP